MTTRDELFQRGEAIRRQLQPRPPASATPSAASAIAGMARLTGEVVFGALWSRPGLALQHRMTCTLSVLSVLQLLPQLRTYLNGALNVGLSKQEVVEVLMHTAPYGGFPKALNALTRAQEVLG